MFEEYGAGIDTSALVGTSMPSDSIAPRMRLPGCVVRATGCPTEGEATGLAFLQGAVRASIAPDDYPDRNDVPVVLMHVFHRLLVRRATVEEAWAHPAGYDEASRMFRLYTPDGVRRWAP